MNLEEKIRCLLGYNKDFFQKALSGYTEIFGVDQLSTNKERYNEGNYEYYNRVFDKTGVGMSLRDMSCGGSSHMAQENLRKIIEKHGMEDTCMAIAKEAIRIGIVVPHLVKECKPQWKVVIKGKDKFIQFDDNNILIIDQEGYLVLPAMQSEIGKRAGINLDSRGKIKLSKYSLKDIVLSQVMDKM